MGSNYFGESNLVGSEKYGGRSSSSRKGKKCSNPEKPKQPQRGLGVAQLEQIRLHSQMAAAAAVSLHNPNYPVTIPNQEDIRLQGPYYSPSSFSYTPTLQSRACYEIEGAQSIKVGNSEQERTHISYSDQRSAPANTSRWWNTGKTVSDTHHYQHPYATRHPPDQDVQESLEKKNKKVRSDWMGSSATPRSESSGSPELDLELRLSL